MFGVQSRFTGNRDLVSGVQRGFIGNRDLVFGVQCRFTGNRDLVSGVQRGFIGNKDLVFGVQSGFTGNRDIFRISDQQTESHLFLCIFQNIGTVGLSLSKQTNKVDTQDFVKTTITFHYCTSFYMSLEIPCLVPQSNSLLFSIRYPLH